MGCVKELCLAQCLWAVQRTGLCQAGNQRGLECVLWSQSTWVQVPTRSGADCVTMGRSSHLSTSQSPCPGTGIMTGPVAQDCGEDV